MIVLWAALLVAAMYTAMKGNDKVGVLKTSEEWLSIYKDMGGGRVIVDPDGWDREDFDASWAEKITWQEFMLRFARSTTKRQSPEQAWEIKMLSGE